MIKLALLVMIAVAMATLVYAIAVHAEAGRAPSAQEALPQLKVGDVASDFSYTIPDSARTGKLSDLKDKKNVLLAFYPKAFTPGCTSQLCGYRDDFAQFKSSNTDVIAISLDAQQKSDAFRTDKKMPFAVLGDPEGKVVSAYGIPRMSVLGFEAAKRSVVLIDKKGIVRYIKIDYNITSDKAPLYDEIAKVSGTPMTPEAKPAATAE